MRSLSFKLVFSFLLVSLIGIILSMLLVRWSTGDAFRQFLSDQEMEEVLTVYSGYYQQNGNWTGVEDVEPFGNDFPAPPEEHHRYPVTLADASGKVILPGPNRETGEYVSQSELADSIQIEVDGQTVGWLVVAAPPRGENKFEARFLERVNASLALSAVGGILLALVLGVILSRTLTRPIREITEATREVSKGNMDLEVPVRSRDELGELASSFNRMSAELSRSLTLRRQMTADIAHELRTPLSLILGHAEAVHDGVLPPSKETFEIIREESERLDHLVEDLRTLSLADADELPMTCEPIAPGKLLQEVKTIYSNSANQKNIGLMVTCPEDLPDVNIDPGRMLQVLKNLMDNALRYTPDGGQVTLSARKAGRQVEISLQDTGPGLGEDDLARIFDRFYRAAPSRNRENGGSGLGLAIAKSLVEKQNARIWAECQAGQGLTVIVAIPL